MGKQNITLSDLHDYLMLLRMEVTLRPSQTKTPHILLVFYWTNVKNKQRIF